MNIFIPEFRSYKACLPFLSFMLIKINYNEFLGICQIVIPKYLSVVKCFRAVGFFCCYSHLLRKKNVVIKAEKLSECGVVISRMHGCNVMYYHTWPNVNAVFYLTLQLTVLIWSVKPLLSGNVAEASCARVSEISRPK